LDLVATGLDGDMMSLRSIETKHLIQKGLKSINNPFLAGMVDKNSFSLGSELTPIGVAFYIVPYINAMVRSGTQEEKKIVFESMLSFKAYKQIPSNKRGHKEGEMETILDQALRTVTNVKNRQTKSVTAGMELLENKIEKENLLSNKVLLFLLEPGEIPPNVAGLAANKIMAKYQRPCCVLTRTTNTIYAEDDNKNKLKSLPIVSYQGSSRGCDIVGVSDFKGVCEQTQTQNYCTGHPGAFGLSINATKIEEFKEKTDELLKDMPDTASYYVDYVFQGYNVDEHKIQEIAALNNLYGKDLDEPFVAIENLKITPDMVTIYDKKGFTLKITLPNGINLMKFKATEEDCNIFQDNELLKINIIGKCNINEYMGKITPQIFIED
jgi:single-stranded-DNA-specific exonuclease